MIRTPTKEEYAIILDFLPHGYPFDTRPLHQKTPIAQVLGLDHFTLLELVPKKGEFLQIHEEVYMGEGKRDKVHHIVGKIQFDKLTQTAKSELELVIKELVKKNEGRFIEFFNRAGPINTRLHQMELLPGIGKKHTEELIQEREKKKFDNFEDIKNRVKLIPNPETAVIKRIFLELESRDKHRLFVQV